MNVRETALRGVLLIDPPTSFSDLRGTYVETYNEKLYKESGIDVNFVQDDISTSKHNVIRGIHGDYETYKLISCLYGKFYLVVVNWDASSTQFKQWDYFTLSDRNRRQVLIPPKHGNGHLILSDVAIFHYKQSTYYNRATQFTIKWNNPELNITWPVKNPILSDRDNNVT
jgi:dTDP-4-dehydrorhamnose 3,5-epimerase